MNSPFGAFIDKIGEALTSVWASTNARPPNFDHLSDNEFEMAKGFYEDFIEKVNRGYFDEDVERDFRRFMFQWGCDKANVDSACLYMRKEAAKAEPALKTIHRKTQDRYWQATGAQDTRHAPMSHE